MLAPSNRKLLADLLAPPDEYKLVHAIATTFTLDLTALLTVPLGFAGRDLSITTNQIELLQKVNTFADRLDVFCQAGAVRIPQKHNQLFSFLEPVIHQVSSPRPGHLFHPKIWVMRFTHQDSASDYPDLFRFICGSRNLTFDRSWDAFVALEGTLRKRRYAVNNPLCRFLESLPARTNGMSEQRKLNLTETVSALNNVEWDWPEGAATDDWLAIHVFGPTSSRRPDTSGRKALIVSPFLNDGGFDSFEECGSLSVISRPDQLNALDQTTKDLLCVPEPNLFVINDYAVLEGNEDEETGAQWELTGLHAKIYAVERGRYTHVMIGSANATEEGWSGNDEVLVEVVGQKSIFGIDTMIGDTSDFRLLLSKHELQEQDPPDEEQELREKLERALRSLAELPLVATITGSDESGWSESVTSHQPFNVSEEDALLRMSLMTDALASRTLMSGSGVNETWNLSELEAATSFITLSLSKGNVSVSTVVMAQLQNAPADRLDRIFAQYISRPELFLQLVSLLLTASGDEDSLSLDDFVNGHQGSASTWLMNGAGLLENILVALSRSPQSVDDVGRLVSQLQATAKGRDVLPVGWEELWESVQIARTRLENSND
jgi:hypothetical protein